MKIHDPPDSIDLDLFKQQIPNQSILDPEAHTLEALKNRWSLYTRDAFEDEDDILELIEELAEADFVYEIRLEWDPESFTSWYVLANGVIIKIITEVDPFGETQYFQVFDWSAREEIATTSVICEICTLPNQMIRVPRDIEQTLDSILDWDIMTLEQRCEAIERSVLTTEV